MDIIKLLDNKEIKSTQKREELAQAIRMGMVTVEEIQSTKELFDDKKMALVLEAMEAVTAKTPGSADMTWLIIAQAFITSQSNALKREASRIVGNIAHLFPDHLETAIKNLLENTADTSTVVRWGSAYALGRIILIPKYANSELFDVMTGLCEKESENGVKNQLLSGLKKPRK